MSRTKLKRFFIGLGIVLLVLVLGYLLIHPLHSRWGATAEDLARSMPGDLNGVRWTRAMVVSATPEQIWPWLVQWGQGRGGWYSYDWLENLLGMEIHTADRILPEYQDTAIGDPICMAANVCTSFVSVIEPQQWFGWQASDEQGKPVWSFTFGLFPVDGARTRLVMRESFDKDAMPAAAVYAIEIPDVVMGQKALDTVKRRAEGRSDSGLTTAFEIGVWLAALAMGVIAGILVIKRKDWKTPLAVGVASVVVLLVMTFLFPPLWLRGVLDLGLLVALVWVYRSSPAELEEI
ncbi:MAG: hypothetical protein JXA21_21500 [Anaerolineae bacterium]|nr:hypothetical protein [Anaerolineae bacterium]